jgi:uncharacterized protein (DUF1499 family)
MAPEWTSVAGGRSGIAQFAFRGRARHTGRPFRERIRSDMIQLVARIALFAVVLCALAAGISGPGYRMGWFQLPTAFGTMLWAGWTAIGISIVALALALVAAFAKPGGSRRGRTEAALAVLIGVATMSGPLLLMSRGKEVPPKHDNTTDTDNPPQFVAVLPLRADAKNPVAYGGPEIAAQQKKAYPTVVPLELPVPPAQVHARAFAAARDMGWTIVSSDPASNRIEATATTPFFGFKDDVVIRVTPSASGSRIDMRSLSRIGGSDLGTNARRVEAYLAKLRE